MHKVACLLAGLIIINDGHDENRLKQAVVSLRSNNHDKCSRLFEEIYREVDL